MDLGLTAFVKLTPKARGVKANTSDWDYSKLKRDSLFYSILVKISRKGSFIEQMK